MSYGQYARKDRSGHGAQVHQDETEHTQSGSLLNHTSGHIMESNQKHTRKLGTVRGLPVERQGNLPEREIKNS